MQEATIYYAHDGSCFSDPRRCLLYEKLLENLGTLKDDGSQVSRSHYLEILQTFFEQNKPGEERLQQMLAVVYFASILSQGVEELRDVLGDVGCVPLSGVKPEARMP